MTSRGFSRTDRVASQIQRELAQLIRDELRDPRLGLITVQAVRVASDLTSARVYFTSMQQTDQGADKDSQRLLNHAAPHLRRLLGQRMKLRQVPELKFVYDESVERGARLLEAIEQAVESDTVGHRDS